MYKTMNVRVAIATLEIWNEKDQFNVTNNTVHTLAEFRAYNLQTLQMEQRGEHDAAHMIT